MANYSRRGYGRNSYGNDNYGRSNYRSNRRNSRRRKLSWCKSGTTKHNQMHLYGGRRVGYGANQSIQLLSAFVDKDPKNHRIETKNGRVITRMLVHMQSGRNFEDAQAAAVQFFTGWFYHDKNHMIIDELGIMMKPNSDYVGPVKRRN